MPLGGCGGGSALIYRKGPVNVIREKCKPRDKTSGKTVHTRGPHTPECQNRERTQPRPRSRPFFRPRAERGMCLQGNLTVWSQTPDSSSQEPEPPQGGHLGRPRYPRGLPLFKASGRASPAGSSALRPPGRRVLSAHLIDEKTETLDTKVALPGSNS